MQTLTSIFNREITVWFDIGWLWFFALSVEDDWKKSERKRRDQAEISNQEETLLRQKLRKRQLRQQFPALRP